MIPLRFVSAARNARATAAGSSGSISAEIAARPATPVSITCAAFSGVMPPMAMTGIFVAETRAFRGSSPIGCTSPSFDGVWNTGPSSA